MKKILIFDTTLRDGTQGEGVSLSVQDKLKVAQVLDRLGVHYIEGGWPGSNPKDEEFFRKARSLKFNQAKLTAFGSTRRKDKPAHRDDNLLAIVRVKTPAACIFGKSWDLHVIHALRVSLDENLQMISDSVKFLKSKGREVIYDAEHFFDGFKANREYAIKAIEGAWKAGANNITLCDTNGGSLPHEVAEIVRFVHDTHPEMALGIHTHNDSGCAIANSLAAVKQGATLVQGSINGIGERCGNADLIAIIPALQLKMGLPCVTEKQLQHLTEVSRHVSELANLVPSDNQPYVGHSAFAHKGGVHVSAMARHTRTYEHMDPDLVGNKRRILVSELSGKANIHLKAKELNLDFDKNPKAVERVIHRVKELENQGYQYEGAEGSFALLVEKMVNNQKPFFDLKAFRVVVEQDRKTGRLFTEATLKIAVDGREEHMVAEGNGPVDALDKALRRALESFYPKIKEMSLRDFKVRVINANAGTGAKVRALIESRDHKDEWGTLGVSENIIEASWQARLDAVEYKLLKDSRKNGSHGKK